LRDLIATSVFKIVKPDKIAKLMAESLLSCPEDIDDITQEGWRKLKHTYGARCLMKTGPGNGPQDYRCRKQHTAKDTPDPTSHQYIKIPCNLSDASKEILMRAGIPRPPSYKGAQDEHYFIPYFQPTRHMAPCITNAQCNMSPIIPIYFIMFKSMCNAQIILQTSGVSKYILKYISKIDECNYVFVFANSRNEDLVTPNQLMIYQDHRVESQSYDTVSMFGMRPMIFMQVCRTVTFASAVGYHSYLNVYI
jgi:hypothetical protein